MSRSYQAELVEITRALARGGERLERARAELQFADRLLALHPEHADDWQARIIEAGRLVAAGVRGAAVDAAALTAQAEEVLAPLGAQAKTYTLLCVSHAHIDMNWMWSWPETVAVTNDTFQTMLALMDEFPGFIYSQSQASTYELIERYSPALFEAIRARVREGRWEVTASQWVEGDKNMASGESLSRHLLYARAYFADRFGLQPEDVQVDFEPDTFGHPATLPTVLARGGVRYYYHCRGSHGPHLYWWLGPDGSRLLAYNDVVWYMATVGPQIADPLPGYVRASGLRFMPVLYGVGDHGGGPTRRDLRRIGELDAWPIYPRVEFSSLHRYFRQAEAQAHGLPEIRGERNFVFTGCYTSQARQKWANRHGENLLYTAEAAATVGSRVAGVPYPHHTLDEAWKDLLFDQFHDILPGSGTRDTRHYALGRAQESQAAAAMARSNALRALCARIDTAAVCGAAGSGEGDEDRSLGAGVGYASGTGGESAFSFGRGGARAFVVFNPLPYKRRDVVEVKLWDADLDPKQLVVESAEGAPQPAQALDEGHFWGHSYRTIAFPVEVPALGYRAYCLSDRMAELGLAPIGTPDPWAGSGGSWRCIQPADRVLENEYLRAVIDPASGGLTSLVDKRSGREWVPEGELSGVLRYCLEANEGMTAWVIGTFRSCTDLLQGGTLSKVLDGPHVQRFRWTGQAHDSQVEMDITLRAGVPRLEYQLRVDWREIGDQERTPHLRVRFPLAMTDGQPRYEIPFGAIHRELTAGEEVPALRWADLSEPDGAGVTLANSSKYGFSVEGQTLNMTLLRASSDPDPLPDLGEHAIEWALAPHGAGWMVGEAMQAGEELNVPLVALSCSAHGGDLPAALSFLHLEPENVRLAALKESQEGGGAILRLVEVAGRDTAARVTLAPALAPAGAAAVNVDTLERPVEEGTARLEGQTLAVQVPAFGIVAVQIK